MLESLGLVALLARDGRDAVGPLGDDPNGVDAVLLDLTIPVLGGEEAFLELRRLRHDIQVVVMSGYTGQETRGRSSAGEGPVAFLQTPFLRDELREVLQQLLEPCEGAVQGHSPGAPEISASLSTEP